MAYIRSMGYMEERIRVKAGEIFGASSVQKFGINSDIDSAAPEDIWSRGGNYVWPAAAAVTTIVSVSGNDSAAGSGARTVRVWGLDSDYNEQDEIVIMDGVTPVTLATYIRVHRMQVLTAGASEGAEGVITVAIGAQVVAEIPLNYNQTEMALFTVPAGKTAFIMSVTCSATDAGTRASTQAMLKVREFGGVFCTKYDIRLATDGTCTETREFLTPITVSEKSDIIMRGSTDRDNTQFVGAFDLILKDATI